MHRLCRKEIRHDQASWHTRRATCKSVCTADSGGLISTATIPGVDNREWPPESRSESRPSRWAEPEQRSDSERRPPPGFRFARISDPEEPGGWDALKSDPAWGADAEPPTAPWPPAD